MAFIFSNMIMGISTFFKP
uniref:Uncharacterized protein n=1 Tax=Rhizophora mucronata TaxID=61149 RepID=A0A2P2KTS1_RHIMU